MNMRNLLNPGDFVMMIPVGLHITLQYNSSGNLEKMYTGYDSNRVDHTEDMIKLMLGNNIVPAKIHITRGTSWVSGVLYTGELIKRSGRLPESVEPDLRGLFIENPKQFNFFAGMIKSTVTIFKGATAMRQNLLMAKFRLLPGWLVPFGISEEVVKSWLSSPQYTFNPIVTDCIIYRKEIVNIVSVNLSQEIVSHTSKYVDDNGYLKVKVEFSGTEKHLYINYSDAMHFNISKGDVLVLDSDNQIVYCKSDSKSRNYSNVITCNYCGKRFHVSDSGDVLCPDVHCPSRMMLGILQFVSVMNLPVYNREIILDWIKKQAVTCIPDLLILEEYKSISLDVSIAKLLRALVPISLIPRDDIFRIFAVACSNQENTFRYYIQNPRQILSDLNIRHADLDKLISWLSDECNASDLTTILNSPQIHFTASDKKFDGAPIFRNKTIYLTGMFIRGAISEIASILQSYSANVVTDYSNFVDCVIIGGKNEDTDGKSIRAAQNCMTPIFEEDEFFKKYGIDADLNQLLGLE